MSQDSRINIFEFTDHREYLGRVIGELKRKQRNFNLRSFAHLAGFRSPSTISMILNGRRPLSTPAAEKVARALALAGRRRNYFLAMARLQSSKTRAGRIEAQEAMLKYRDKPGSTLLPQKHYRLLANWFYPALYVLGGMNNTNWDVRSLAKRLGRGVSIDDIKLALSDLLSLGLLKFENGRFTRGSGRVTTAEDLQDIGIFRYHRRMIELASEALERPLDEREMNGLTVAIPLELLPRVKEKIRAFRREINESLIPFEAEATEVYQLNIQLFRITEREKGE